MTTPRNYQREAEIRTNIAGTNPEQLGRNWRVTLDVRQTTKGFGRNWRVNLGTREQKAS